MIPLWNDLYNKFEISSILENTVTNDVDQFILKQPKNIRDAIRGHEVMAGIRWNSIEHVNNFIKSKF